MQNKRIKLMEVCGTHTMAIARSGIKKVLPEGIELISGPGCPVCVTAQEDIDRAIQIAKIEDVAITTFGDMMKVPGSEASLEEVRASGGDVRIVYSCEDALKIAEENPSKRVVFMGVGFETTSPTIAATIIEAKKRDIKNFFVLANFKVIFPALEVLASSKDVKIDGFICPGHVSVITGSAPYERIAEEYKKPCVIMGFEDDDILKGIKRLVSQAKKGEHKVEVEYIRAVGRGGNPEARKVMAEVFKETDSDWRGIGIIPGSGLKIKGKYSRFDAEHEFKIKIKKTKKKTGCICGEVLQGIKTPTKCALFGKQCTPQRPVGPCMVSSEGTCAAYFKYGA